MAGYLSLGALLALAALSSAEDTAGGAFVYSLDSFAARTKPAFVKFFAPWCGHCKRLAPTWEELADTVAEDSGEVVIGKVDCTVETKLCSDNGVSGYPTLKFFPVEGESVKYKGQRDVKFFKRFINDQMNKEEEEEKVEDAKPAAAAEAKDGLYELDATNFDAHIAKGSHFIKFYAPWCGHCKRLAPIWDQLAEQFTDEQSVKIGKIDCTTSREMCGKFEVRGYPTLLFIKDGQMTKKYAGARDLANLKKFAEEQGAAKAAPAEEKKEEKKEEKQEEEVKGLLVLNGDNVKNILASEKFTFVKFYAPWCGHCKHMAADWAKMAEKYANSDKAQIAKMDCTISREECSDYGVGGFPTLKVFRAGKEVKAHRGGRDVATLSKVLEDAMSAADEKPAEKEPEKESAVTELTVDSAEAVLAGDHLSFVQFFAPWCGHCKMMAPEWERLGETYKDDDSVVVAKVDCTQHSPLCGAHSVQGFPTLKLFRGGAEITEYEGQRNLAGFKAFLARNQQQEQEAEKKDEL